MKSLLLLFLRMFLIVLFSFHPYLFSQSNQLTKKIPIIESGSTGNKPYYVILYTGNGGWRELVQYVTHYLNSKNVSVLAINTKQYLLSEKKPARIAFDLETLMNEYDNKWEKDNVVLIGYSMGAEILPFVVNSLEDSYRNKLHDLILIGPWQKATFKVALADYFYETNKGEDIYSELLKMKNKNAYIICDDNDLSLCHKDLDGIVSHDMLGGGHHFDGDYDALSKLIGKRLKLE